MLKRSMLLGMVALLLFAAAFPVFSQNLRGANVVIANWWADYDTNTFQPRNSAEEATLAWRQRIQRENSFTMSERMIASWGEMSGLTATSIMSNRPPSGLPANTLMVYTLQGDWAMALQRQSLLYPISDRLNFSRPPTADRNSPAPRWNARTPEDFKFRGKSYGFSIDINMTNAQVIFFNKRLFREAGLDPNLPYDLQRSGQWTWERFVEVCKQLTRDINNDGIMDTYALPRDLSTDILDAIVASNGANYITRNARSGRFELGINTPEFMEALQFAIRLNNEGVMKPRPDDTNWDWYKAEFADGRVAMRVDESYVWGELGNMRDDWGVVLFPRGPKVNNYRVFTRENVFIIPANYTRQQVDQIVRALTLWYTPQDDDWKTGMYATFRDRRAVDETLALIRDTNLHIPKNHIFIPGLNRGAGFAWEMWHHDGDPAQLVEGVSSLWNALIADVNEELGL